jgi:hypothetical protein
MRIRRIISEPKVLESDTNWRTDDLQHRYSLIFDKTKPIRGGWQWRSVTASGTAGREYVFLTQCNPAKDNWKAWLIFKTPKGEPSLVSRLEYHGTHPGLHVHAHCERGGLEEGPSSIDGLDRIPPAHRPHRRNNITWREHAFWEQARRHFRIEHPTGTLL